MFRRRLAPILFYLLIGGTTALVYVLVCLFLTRLGAATGPASVLGYLLVMPPAYFGQKLLTFRSPSRHGIAFPRYAALQLAGNIAGYFLSDTLVRSGTPGWAAFAAVAVMVAGTNFFAMKYWAFHA